MNKNISKSEYINLCKEINHANYMYYVQSNPIMSDFEFDSKFRELQIIENNYPKFKNSLSPSLRIGSPPSKEFSQIQHIKPMTSLANALNKDELINWYEKTMGLLDNENLEVICELKIDGLAVSLVYKNGILDRAGTRGDGVIGEDITNNIRTIKTVPLELKYDSQIPNLIELRGEVFFPKNKFNKINNERIKSGLEPYVSTRNSASGSLRQLNSAETAKRPLDIFFYSLGESNINNLFTHNETLQKIKSFGGKINSWTRKASNINQIFDAIKDAGDIRSKINYEIDGVVIKVNNLEFQNNLGISGRDPRWAIAYKFPPEKNITILKKIHVNVGRTGALTPWAELQPVVIGGVTIKKATLHNSDEIERKDLREGDKVIVQRAGDVIPQVVSVVDRKINLPKFEFPKYCPDCKSDVVKLEKDAISRCLNIKCPTQFERLLQHYASKTAMNIETLGVSLSQTLSRSGLIKNLSDIYILDQKVEDLLNLENMGTKKIDNLFKSIKESKNRDFYRLIFALGIPNIGIETAKWITNKFNNFSEITSAPLEEFTNIKGIGEITGTIIFRWFKVEENIILINNLQSLGINSENNLEDRKSFELENLTFVITGRLDNITRGEAKNIIEKFGGKTSNSVSKNTNFLVSGEKPGSKLATAITLNIPILTEQDFLQFLKDHNI